MYTSPQTLKVRNRYTSESVQNTEMALLSQAMNAPGDEPLRYSPNVSIDLGFTTPRPLPELTKSGPKKPQMIKRNSSLLDLPAQHTEESQHLTRSAAKNKQDFLLNYAIEAKLPSLYTLDSMFFRRHPKFILQISRIVFPKTTNHKTITHKLDGNVDNQPYEELFEAEKNSLSLNLLEVTSSMIISRDTTVFKSNKAAKMALSKDGDIFAIFLEDTQTFHFLKLGNSSPQEAFQAMKENAWDLTFEADSVHLDFVEHIIFDVNNRYLVAFGKQEFYVVALDFEGKKAEAEVFRLNAAVFDQILDITFISKDEEEQTDRKLDKADYSCFIAAKRKGLRQVSVFDYSTTPEHLFFVGRGGDEADDHIQNINMKHEPDASLRVKISSGFDRIVLTSSNEKFILERHEDGFFIQKKLYQLQDLEVHYIQEEGADGFVFLASSTYDTSLSLIQTRPSSVEIKFPKDVEPGIISVSDLAIKVNRASGEPEQLQIAGTTDNQLFVDQAEVRSSQTLYQTFELDALSDLSFNWPFVTFTDLSHHIMVINCYDRSVVRRLQVFREGDVAEICQTFITNALNLFLLVHSNNVYRLYKVDLKALGGMAQARYPVLGSPILIYTEMDVGKRQFSAMHVRGSSKQMNHDVNEVLSVFFLHDGMLFNWTALSKKQRVNQISEVCPFSSHKFLVKNESNFCFLQNTEGPDGQLQEQRIMEIQVNFSTFETRSLYKEKVDNECIESASIDQAVGKIILLTRRQVEDSKPSFFFKIFDIAEQSITFSIEIKFAPLIGKLMSGLYTLQGGHIYYNNNVIKIRYDLIEAEEKYKENQVFDYYFNIFDLGESMRVRSSTPLNSIFSHRFAYFVYDTTFARASRVILLPYLHDRQLFLHRVEEGTDYFYTSVRTTVADEEAFNSQFGPATVNKEASSLYHSLSRKSTGIERRNKLQSFNSIIAIDQTFFQFSVFSQDGILINHVDFRDQVAKYGVPVAASSNGLNFVFRKEVETMEPTSSPSRFFQVHIFRMSIFGMHHVKEVNILDNILDFIAKEEVSPSTSGLSSRIDSMTFPELRKNIALTLLINDNSELAVIARFKPPRHNDKDFLCELESDASIFQEEEEDLEEEASPALVYFERCEFRLSQDIEEAFLSKSLKAEFAAKLGKTQGEGLQQVFVIGKAESAQGFSLSNSSLFYWAKHRAYRYSLAKPLTQKNRVTLKFELDQNNPSTFIKDIRTGSHPAVVVLVVKISPKMDILVIWESLNNFEIDAREIKGMYKILWDQKGSPYIVLPDKVIFVKPKASVKAFEYNPSIVKAARRGARLSGASGHSFDGDNHNWFVMRGFLAMPFSFMTFVIKDKIEKEDELQRGNIFDLEPYSYIFNMCTAFIQSEFVRSDHLELANVLENFNKLDPVLLELLHYTHDIFSSGEGSEKEKPIKIGRNSAIHIAMHSGNSMSVELLLKYMTLIPSNSSRAFASIFPDLVEFKSFLGYLEGLPVQTLQMQKKRVFRTNTPESDLIVAMKEAKSVYIDEYFYSQKMKELPASTSGQYKSYPVDVVSLRIGWILTTNNGRRFLERVFRTENLEIYKIHSIQMIVDFLYSKQKIRLLFSLLPLYILQFALFYAILFFYEKYVAHELEFIQEFGQPKTTTLASVATQVDAATLANMTTIANVTLANVTTLADVTRATATALANVTLTNVTLTNVILSNLTINATGMMIDAKEAAASKTETESLISQSNDHAFYENWLVGLNLSMLGLIICLSYLYVSHIMKNGLRSFKRLGTWLDFINLSLNSIVAILIQVQTNIDFSLSGKTENKDFNNFTQVNRYLMIVCILLGYIKIGTLFRLIDSFAPIVDQITQIFFDIRHFMLVLVLSGFCFATCYYIVAHNQLEFDEIEKADEREKIDYNTVSGAIWYSWNNFVVGNAGVATYGYGNKGQETVLCLLFAAGGFIMMIHLLNMLIAMMGNTFNERSEVASEIRTRDHLRFVLENWHLNRETIEDMDNMKYIVAAFSATKQYS